MFVKMYGGKQELVQRAETDEVSAFIPLNHVFETGSLLKPKAYYWFA